jgi:hypothetical protein
MRRITASQKEDTFLLKIYVPMSEAFEEVVDSLTPYSPLRRCSFFRRQLRAAI